MEAFKTQINTFCLFYRKRNTYLYIYGPHQSWYF